MKRQLTVFFLAVLLTTACTDRDVKDRTHKGHSHMMTSYEFVPVDSANKMIQSYLNSIGYPTTDTNLLSLSINADSLRSYLSDTAISDVKLMLAHTLAYINGGGKDENCGYKSSALTVIIAGYDKDGNYIYAPNNMVIDRGVPCPTNCPPGEAAQPLLTLSPVAK